MIIYKITNIQNNKVYIGQTSENIMTRFNRHMGYQSWETDTKFYRAVRKYGKENFTIEEIDTAQTQDELDKKEVYWINFFDSVSKGYNSHNNKGKCGGDTLTNHPNLTEIKEKISQSKMGGKNPHAKQIKAININTKEEKIYDSMSECQKDLGIKYHSNISRRCRGITKSPYKKTWFFEYIS